MITGTLRPPGEMWVRTLFPSTLSLNTYIDIIFGRGKEFATFYRNSIVISIATTLITLVLATPAAYGFSRFKFKGNTTFLLLVLLNQMFPKVLLSIPYFLMISELKMYNTLFAVILMDVVYTLPFALFMMKGWFDSIPPAIDESALIDGCSRVGVIFRIMMPISKTMLFASGATCFLFTWNEYLFCRTFTSDPELRTVTIGIGEAIGQFYIDFPRLMASATLASIPVIIVFIVIQKYFIRGILSGALKM
jgi:ABC-type glycerol-3-phosphate transport system permease component